MNTLQVVAKSVHKRAKKLRDNGQMPIVLGVDGLIALVWDRFQRHVQGKEELELLDAAALALLVYHASQAPELESLAQETWDDPLPPPEEEEASSTLAICPHCGESDKTCTIIPDALLPICDECVESFESPEAYQEWAESFSSGDDATQ